VNEFERTENLIIEALAADGGWLDQRQIRRDTGLPMSRVENFTLSMALEGKISRRLVDGDHTQQFRSLADAG
jgi:DNA-binding IclR family transcriptional regulator